MPFPIFSNGSAKVREFGKSAKKSLKFFTAKGRGQKAEKFIIKKQA
jgi:hypothetical protein